MCLEADPSGRPLWIEGLAGIRRHDTRVSVVPKKFTPLGAKLFHELAATVAANDNDPNAIRKVEARNQTRKPRTISTYRRPCTEA